MNNPLSKCLTNVKQTLKSGQESGNNSNVSNGRIPLTLITRISSLTFPKCNTLSEKRKICVNHPLVTHYTEMFVLPCPIVLTQTEENLHGITCVCYLFSVKRGSKKCVSFSFLLYNSE